MTVCDTKSGEAKTDTLDGTFENYMFGCLAHFKLTIYYRLDNLAPFWAIY
jgi:hypothetical protein